MSAEVNGEVSHLPRKAAGATTPLQYSRGGDPSTMTSLPAAVAHEVFATPSSFLRRSRGYSRPMAPVKPVNAVDREQHRGLVSTPFSQSERRCLYSIFRHGQRTVIIMQKTL